MHVKMHVYFESSNKLNKQSRYPAATYAKKMSFIFKTWFVTREIMLFK